jgi:hypothetical protein
MILLTKVIFCVPKDNILVQTAYCARATECQMIAKQQYPLGVRCQMRGLVKVILKRPIAT